MPRPKKHRCIRFQPSVMYFKPRGVPLFELAEVELSRDELEALRLKNIVGNDQVVSAQEMHISQSTFQRILTSANKKIADAIVNGKALRIEKN